MKLHPLAAFFYVLAIVAIVNVNAEEEVEVDDPPPGVPSGGAGSSDVNCPSSGIKNGDNCCSVIPDGETEAACFIDGGATECRCAGQDNICDDTGWSCISIVESPSAAIISADSAEPSKSPNSVPTVDSPAPTASAVPQSEVPVVSPTSDKDCAGSPCDPSDEESCSCRPGLVCRIRSLNDYMCSQEPRLGRSRLSGPGIGGAGGRDRSQGNQPLRRLK